MPELKLFGGAHLEDDQGPHPGLSARRYPLALLALLALSPARRVSRGKLVGLLWPEAPERVARNRLTTCIYEVRSALGDRIITSVGGDLSFDPDALPCDVVQFDAYLASGAHDRAVSLYRGPFLDGFWLRDAAEFDQWVERERERLGRGFHDALEALAREAEQQGDPETASGWWRRRVEETPYDSRVVGRLLETLTAAGRSAEALRAARAHATLLADELGTEPAAEFGELVETIQSRSARRTPTVARTHDATAPSECVVAVLPFRNVSGQDETEPFTVGLHDDLLTELARVPGLTVIARASVQRFHDADRPLAEIARELGAGTIIEGGVQSSGGRLRLNVQLIDAASGTHRWVERYDRELSTGGIFDIQSELARRIAASLRGELDPASPRPRGQQRTRSLEAYRLCALGRRMRDRRTPEGLRRAVAYYEHALEIDPLYVDAWVGVGTALALLLDYRHIDHAERPRAERAIRRALELDPQLPEAYGALGAFYSAIGEHAAGEQPLRRAIALNPGYSEAHNWLSWNYLVLGRGEEALENALLAVELDPLLPEAISNLSLSFTVTGNPERALVEARRLRELQPEWSTTPFYEAVALYHLGRFDEVIELLHGLRVEWAGAGPRLTLALACAALGDTHAARALHAEFVADGDGYSAAVVELALGENDVAFERMRAADLTTYWPALSLHFLYPDVLAPVRASPLYAELLRRLQP